MIIDTVNMRYRRGLAILLVSWTMHGAAPAGAQIPEPQGLRPVVAIMDFTNSSLVDHEVYEPFTVGVAGMLLVQLSQTAEIELVERERLRQVLDEIELGQSDLVDPNSVARAGRILGANYIIFGVFVIDRRENLRLDARAVDVETSRVVHVETVEDDADNLLRAVHTLGDQLSRGLDLPMREAPARGQPQEADDGQVLANLKYARALREEDRRNSMEALALYRQFLSETPDDYAPVMRQNAAERIKVLQSTQH